MSEFQSCGLQLNKKNFVFFIVQFVFKIRKLYNDEYKYEVFH